MTAKEDIKTDFATELPHFSKVPDLTTLNTQFVSSFNTGITIYQCLNYLQGYVELTYDELVKLVEELEAFRAELIKYIDELEEKLENEIKAEAEARKDADDAEAKARQDADDAEAKARQDADEAEAKARQEAIQSLDDKKVNRSGDTMTGDLNAPNLILSGAVRTSTGAGNPAILAGYSSKVEAGTSARTFNINGSGTRPTYNSVNQLAFLSDITSAGGGNVTIIKKETSTVLDGSVKYIVRDTGLEDNWECDLIALVFGGQYSDAQTYQNQRTAVIANLKNMAENATNYLFANSMVNNYYSGLSQVDQIVIGQRILITKEVQANEHVIVIDSDTNNYTQLTIPTGTASQIYGYAINGQNPPHLIGVYLIKIEDIATASTTSADETQEEPTTGDAETSESVSAETSENSTEETTGTTSKDEAKAEAEAEKIQKKTEAKETTKQTEPTQSNEPTL